MIENNVTTVDQPVSIIFACDESGAKSYADKGETYPGEVGVFAGILMPEAEKESKLPAFQALIQKYKPKSGKLHIADLEPEVQQQLREDVYATITASRLPCFWYAIHVAGFHDHYSRFGAVAIHMSRTPNPRFRQSNNVPEHELLHEALFAGLYGRLIAFCEERLVTEVNIEIWSDWVDEPIRKKFVKSADTLSDFGTVTEKVKAYDMLAEQQIEGTVTINVKIPDSMTIDTKVAHFNFIRAGDDDGLVLAADVLANSLVYLFKNRKPEDLYSDLNRPEAIADHPLAKSFDSFRDWGSGDRIGDKLYRHPNR